MVNRITFFPVISVPLRIGCAIIKIEKIKMLNKNLDCIIFLTEIVSFLKQIKYKKYSFHAL